VNEPNIVLSIHNSPSADYIRRDLISCVMYELMKELRRTFLTADSRALIVHRNLTLDLYALRLKLQIQSLTGGRTRREIRFSSSARACRERGDNATRFNNSERFSPLFFLLFFCKTVGRLIIYARWTRYVAKEKNRCRATALSRKELSLECASRSRFHRAALRKHPRRLLAA